MRPRRAVVICRDGQRLAQLSRALAFFGPTSRSTSFRRGIACVRTALADAGRGAADDHAVAPRALKGARARRRPHPVNAAPSALPRATDRDAVAFAAPGNVLAMDGVTKWLELNGYNRTSTVREPGDYAVRGGIVDLYPPGMGDPVRLDFLRRHAGIDPQLRCRDATLDGHAAAH
jgi:transcription-repair coupling factor (superfamily II helicase)